MLRKPVPESTFAMAPLLPYRITATFANVNGVPLIIIRVILPNGRTILKWNIDIELDFGLNQSCYRIAIEGLDTVYFYDSREAEDEFSYRQFETEFFPEGALRIVSAPNAYGCLLLSGDKELVRLDLDQVAADNDFAPFHNSSSSDWFTHNGAFLRSDEHPYRVKEWRARDRNYHDVADLL